MSIFSKQPEMPLGLGIALMKNPGALKSYTAMTNEQKLAVIENTHNIDSKPEMESYVQSIAMQ